MLSNTMNNPSSVHLVHILHQSLDADASVRKSAEEQLSAMAKQNGFLPALLHLMQNSAQSDPASIQAGSIYFKNAVKKWWEEKDVFAEQDKAHVRAHLIPMLVAVAANARVQLTYAMGTILAADFPDKWPTFLTEVHALLQSGDQHAVYAGLLGLSEIIKLFRWRSNEKRAPLNGIVKTMFPSLLQIASHLMPLSCDQAEAGMMLKEIFKIFFASINYELPPQLKQEQHLSPWISLLLQAVDKRVDAGLLPEDEDERAKMPWWRAKKWAYKILNKLFQRYGANTSGSFRDKSYEQFSKLFMSSYVKVILGCYMKQVESMIRQEQWIPRKVVNMIVLFLTEAVKHKTSWNEMTPHVESLISHFMFPLICFTDADQELWEDDAVEYLQKKTDPFEDFESPNSSALAFMQSLVKDRPKVTLMPMLTFLNHLLSTYQPTPELAKRKDGALALLGALAEILLTPKNGVRDQVPHIIRQFLLPELQSPFAFLRVRACIVLRMFAERNDFEFGEEDSECQREWQACFLNVLQIMHASDLVVRVNAALAVAELIERTGVRDAAAPHLPFIMESLLQLTNAIDMDTLTGAMERFVELFPHELIPFSVQLCSQLRDSFLRMMADATQAAASVDVNADDNDFVWDETTDKTMAAMGILKTMSTLVLSVPDEMADRGVLLEQLEAALLPVVLFTIQNEIVDLYEEAFEVLDACTFELKRITPNMWSLFEPICTTVKSAGIDFLEEIFPSLDNYVSYGKEMIVSNPQLLEAFVSIVHLIMTQEDVDESEQIFGFKLMESMLLHLTGYMDKYLPSFLQMSFQRLLDAHNNAYFVHCLEVPINCIYYNPLLTLQILTHMHSLVPFFQMWFQHHAKLTRVHDKKLSAAALMKLIAETSQNEQALAEIRDSYPTLMANLLQFLSTLPKAEEARAELAKMYEGDSDDGEDDDEDSDASFVVDEDDEEEEEVDEAGAGAEEAVEYADDEDVPDDDEEYLQFLTRKAQQSMANEESDEEDEDWSNELSEELYYETPLDQVNVYMQFQELMSHLASHKPAVYQSLTGHWTADDQQKVSTIVAKAQQKPSEKQ